MQNNLLKETRDHIANIFREKYNGRVKVIDTINAKTFSLTGFDIKYDGEPQYVAVRMQNRLMYDSKNSLHFARFLPDDEFQKYFFDHISAQLEEDAAYKLKPTEIIESRPQLLMMTLKDVFKIPYDGFGLTTNFKNPEETGRRLLTLDNLIDETLLIPRETILLPNQTSDVQKVKKYGTNR